MQHTYTVLVPVLDIIPVIPFKRYIIQLWKVATMSRDIFQLLKSDLCELVGNLVFYAQSAIAVISGRFVRIKKIKKEIKYKCFFFKNKNVDGGNLRQTDLFWYALVLVRLSHVGVFTNAITVRIGNLFRLIGRLV